MSETMIRFVIRTANIPNAAAGSTASHRCWWVAGVADGRPVAGFLPRDEVTGVEIESPMQLIGMIVEGWPARVQKRPDSIWISYLRPVMEEVDEISIGDIIAPVDTQDEGAIASLHRAAGDAAYRSFVRDAVADISAHLRQVSDKLNKTADAIKSLGNL